MKIKIEKIPDAYGRNRQYVVTFGISHLAYGETPENAITQFRKLFPETIQNHELANPII